MGLYTRTRVYTRSISTYLKAVFFPFFLLAWIKYWAISSRCVCNLRKSDAKRLFKVNSGCFPVLPRLPPRLRIAEEGCVRHSSRDNCWRWCERKGSTILTLWPQISRPPHSTSLISQTSDSFRFNRFIKIYKGTRQYYASFRGSVRKRAV